MATRKINESSSYGMTITDDGTDAGKVIGNMSAAFSTCIPSISISASLAQDAVMPSDLSIVQKQITDFIVQVRTQAANQGMMQFGNAAE